MALRSGEVINDLSDWFVNEAERCWLLPSFYSGNGN